MIKKLLNKIKGLISKNKKTDKEKIENECPYKLEPKEDITESKIESKTLKCEHCKEELKGKESSEDEVGAKYIWCINCNYVNKIKDNKVIKKDNNVQEVMKAFNLFKEAGHSPNKYAFAEESKKNTFER